MKIVLGLGLDSMQPKRKTSTLGTKALGPLGMLSLLETQCGIAPATESATTRIIQYLGCLSACDHEARFYHRSFAVDQFNVAKTLLHWRDSWYESGWDGQFLPARGTVAQRLADLAEVEQLAKTQVSFGLGQRLQRVLALLAVQSTHIQHLTLLNPLADFPPLWQQVLQHFSCMEAEELAPSSANTENDLSRVQHTLSQLVTGGLDKQPDGAIAKVHLQGDASFTVLNAHSKAISARLIAQWLQQQSAVLRTNSVALLAGADGYLVDDALAAVDLPRLGFEHTAPWRPVLQVLPIALALLWEPLNPETLLQFLMHPVGLLPRRIRYPLAEVVAVAPGIGGEQWQQKLTSLLNKESARESYTEAGFKQLNEDLSYWFTSAHYTPEQGMPLDIALQRIVKVMHWLTQQAALSTDEGMCKLFGLAHQQANELKTALTDLLQQGSLVIFPEQLQLLLQQLTGAGTGIVDQTAECIAGQSPWLVGATQADSFYTPVDTVVWWDLQQTTASTSLPWSKQEIVQLHAQGVQLPDMQQQLQQQALQWLKPIFAAKERLLIVCHDDQVLQHPLWDQISSCLENWREITVEDSILTQEMLTQLDALPTLSAPFLPLAPIQRWWQLDSNAYLAKREQESYSSLENFFYSPYQWVLHYKAQLTAGTLQALNDGNTLKGLLVHRLYQLFFTQHSVLLTSNSEAPDTVNSWFDQTLLQLLREQGAVLLQPGRMIEKEQFIATARQSLHELLHQLRVAKVVQVHLELRQEAQFFGGKLLGYFDMLVVNEQQQEAVIDIKWGSAKYRKASLKDNTHLQLVTYAYLRHKNTTLQSWPAVAYYIIDGGGMMLAQDTFYFPAAQAIQANTTENHAAIWQKMHITWDWRRAQLDQGLIEVTVKGTQPDTDSDPGEDALAIPTHNDNFNDYRVLTGFGAK